MPTRLFTCSAVYKCLEEVLEVRPTYCIEVGPSGVPDQPDNMARALAAELNGNWLANAGPFADHRFYGYRVSTDVVAGRGPCQHWDSRNVNHQPGENAAADMITFVITRRGTRTDLDPQGRPIKSIANLQLSLVNARSIDCNSIMSAQYNDLTTAFNQLWPLTIELPIGTFSACIYSHIAFAEDQIVMVESQTLSGVFGSRRDRVLNTSNKGRKRPIVVS